MRLMTDTSLFFNIKKISAAYDGNGEVSVLEQLKRFGVRSYKPARRGFPSSLVQLPGTHTGISLLFLGG
jgi:hypothetical protein